MNTHRRFLVTLAFAIFFLAGCSSSAEDNDGHHGGDHHKDDHHQGIDHERMHNSPEHEQMRKLHHPEQN